MEVSMPQHKFPTAAIETERAVAPFDEGGEKSVQSDNAPDDEKKSDDRGDELMGKQRTRRNYLQQQDGEEEEPPSLATRKNVTRRAKTAGDILKTSVTSSSQLSPSDRQSAMQQHLNFAALKRDILSIKQPPPPQTSDIVVRTPTQELLSPPKVMKQKMWETSPHPLRGLTKMSKDTTAIVSPSPEGAWPSFYDKSIDMDDPLEGKIPSPAAKKILSTNDRELSGGRRQTPTSSYDSIRNRVLDEFDSVMAAARQEFNEVPFRSGSRDCKEGAYYQKHRQVYSEDQDDLLSGPRNGSSNEDKGEKNDTDSAPEGEQRTSIPPRDMDLRSETLVEGSSYPKLSQSQPENAVGKTKPLTGAYREMTPKKDLQSSDKSAEWLQQRLVAKKEINDAILARNDETAPTDGQHKEFAEELAKALEALPPPHDSSMDYNIKGESNQSKEDEEVAAITEEESAMNANDQRKIRKQGFEPEYKSGSNNDNVEKPLPRRLDYGKSEVGGPSNNNVKRTTNSKSTTGSEESANRDKSGRAVNPLENGRTNPVILASQGFSPDNNLNNISLDSQLKEEMRRFACDTRAALRVNATPQTVKDGPNVSNPQFRSIAVSTSLRSAMPDNNFDAVEVEKAFKDKDPGLSVGCPAPRVALSGSEGALSEGSDFAEIQNMTPVLAETMDSVYGIAKGDITISLLNENTGRIDTSRSATWANRVHGAIWRCRRMRRSMGGFPSIESQIPKGSPAKGRSSLPVDTDKARVAGGVQRVAATQDAALEHLKHDEIDEALELFEDIIFAYYKYFDDSLNVREQNPSLQGGLGTTDFKPYIGVALHNLGILNLLNGQYQEALSFFTRAVDNRKSCLGEGHPDHVVSNHARMVQAFRIDTNIFFISQSSLVKLSICFYALNEFAEAHARLEEALEYVRQCCPTLDDRVQMAEILNNLGCLAYMCGQPIAAKAFFRDSLDVQFQALSESLYESSALVGQSISLNISITRSNIGFVKLITKDLPVAVTALENALMVTPQMFFSVERLL